MNNATQSIALNSYSPASLAKIPYFATTIVLATLLNLVQLVVFSCMNSKTYSNSLFLAIGVADLISGCFLIPIYAVTRIHLVWPFSWHFCQIYLAINHFTYTICCSLLCMLAYHRYMQISRPFKQTEIVTKKRRLYIALPWLGFLLFYSIMSVFQGVYKEFDYVRCTFHYNPVFVVLETVAFLVCPMGLTITFSLLTLIKISRKKLMMKNRVPRVPSYQLSKLTGRANQTKDAQDESLTADESNSVSLTNLPSQSNLERTKRLDKSKKAVICIIMIIFNSIATQSFLLVMYPYAFLCKCNYDLFFWACDVLLLFPMLNPVVVFIFHDSFKSELDAKIRSLKTRLIRS